MCLLGGGRLDFWTAYSSSGVRCLSQCPSGATEVFSTCVSATLPGMGRELAITLQVSCDTCLGSDQGLSVAAELWVGVARMLHVPLQETSAAVLTAASSRRSTYPVEHFTLVRQGEARLLGSSTLGPPGGRWDIFVAVRVHTSRLATGDAGLQALLARTARPLAQVLDVAAGIYIFEAAQQPCAWVPDMSLLSNTFKIQGCDWDEDPSLGTCGPASGDTQQTTRSTVADSTTAVVVRVSPMPSSTSPMRTTTSAECPCEASWLGDGICDTNCNNQACSFDYGDCATQKPTTTSAASTLQVVPDSLTVRLSGSVPGYNLGDYAGVYNHNPQPNNFNVFSHSQGITDLYWQGDQMRWAFGPKVCADSTDSRYGCGSWYVQVPQGALQMYSDRIDQNGLAFTWHMAGESTSTAALRGTTTAPRPTTPPYTTRTNAVAASTSTLAAGASGQVRDVVSLNVQSSSSATDPQTAAWRVVAVTPQSAAWYIDEAPGAATETVPHTISPIIIGLIVSVALICLLVVCCLARRRSSASSEVFAVNSEKVQHQHTEKGQQQHQDSYASTRSVQSEDSDDSVGSTQSGLNVSRGSTDTTGSWSSWAEPSRAPPPFAAGTKKEPKVHPEPEADHLPRNLKGGWRSEGRGRPRSSQASFSKASPQGTATGACPSTPVKRARSESAPSVPRFAADPGGKSKASASAAAAAAAASSAFSSFGAAAAEAAASAARTAAEDEREKEWQRQVDAAQERRRREKECEEAEAQRRRKAREDEEAGAQRRHQAREAAEAERRRQAAAEEARRRRDAEDAENARRWCQDEKRRQQEEQRRPSAPPAPERRPPPEQPRDTAPPPKARRSASEPKPPKESGGARRFPFFHFRGERAEDAAPEPEEAKNKKRPQADKRAKDSSRSVPPSPSRASTTRQEAPKRGSRGSQPAAKEPEDPAKLAEPLIRDMRQQLDKARRESLEVRKKVFKELQRQLHPDKNPDNAEAAKLAFQSLMESRGPFLSP